MDVKLIYSLTLIRAQADEVVEDTVLTVDDSLVLEDGGGVVVELADEEVAAAKDEVMLKPRGPLGTAVAVDCAESADERL